MDNTKNKEMDRKLGGTHEEDENLGRQSPGRQPADDRSTRQQSGDRENERIGEDEDSER